MKRFAPLVIIVGLMSIMFVTPASAAGSSSQSSNVWANYYQDYYTGQPVNESWHYAGTEQDPYVSQLCAPQECASVVIVTGKGKKASAHLNQVTGETFVSGYAYYSNQDSSTSFGTTWNGSAIPLVRTVKNGKGKAVTLTLKSAYASLYNPAFPVPNYTCCK